jgi:hypothetical protein
MRGILGREFAACCFRADIGWLLMISVRTCANQFVIVDALREVAGDRIFLAAEEKLGLSLRYLATVSNWTLPSSAAFRSLVASRKLSLNLSLAAIVGNSR